MHYLGRGGGEEGIRLTDSRNNFSLFVDVKKWFKLAEIMENYGNFCRATEIWTPELISIWSIFLHFWQETKKTFFLVCWYYFLGPIWGHFKQKVPIYRCSAKFCSKWPRKEPNFKKYQKFQKQVLFESQNASFLPKAKKYGQNGDEFHCLEANFQTP